MVSSEQRNTPGELRTHATAIQVSLNSETVVTFSSPNCISEVYFPKLQTPASSAGSTAQPGPALDPGGKPWRWMTSCPVQGNYERWWWWRGCSLAVTVRWLWHTAGKVYSTQTLVVFTVYQLMAGFTLRQIRITCMSGRLSLPSWERVAEWCERLSRITVDPNLLGWWPPKTEQSRPLIPWASPPKELVSLLRLFHLKNFRVHEKK